jgi:hypothetical protein
MSMGAVYEEVCTEAPPPPPCDDDGHNTSTYQVVATPGQQVIGRIAPPHRLQAGG